MHISFVIGNSFYIHGGFDEFNNITDQVNILNLDSLTWSTLENPNTLGSVYGHSCVVFNKKEKMSLHLLNSIYNSYKYDPLSSNDEVDLRLLISDKKTKEQLLSINETSQVQGRVYIFGGKNFEGKGSDDLRVMEIDNDKERIWKVDTLGQRPCPRIGHSMIEITKGKTFAVLGGIKIDNEGNQQNIFLNDFFLYNVETHCWTELSISQPSLVCSNFGICKIEYNGFLMYGGLDQNNFVGGSFLKLSIREKNSEIEQIDKESKIQNSENDFSQLSSD